MDLLELQGVWLGSRGAGSAGGDGPKVTLEDLGRVLGGDRRRLIRDDEEALLLILALAEEDDLC